MICKPRHYNSRTFVGDVKNPIAIGKKGELWANLDDEFFDIMELWRWKQTGMLEVKLENTTYPIALGIRHLVEDTR